MGEIKQNDFRYENLFLDVRLNACSEKGGRDFTGKKTFSVGMFQQNIGFGITNIDIQINTSLQPSITITFKDLYGNTLYGTQQGDIDYSVLFDWPPPKFILTFKGYLGRPVTWILNLKNLQINYVATDSSHEVVCDFVPNQWGFLSDMPFAYLYATPFLRGQNDIKDSILGIIKIGIETKITESEVSTKFKGTLTDLGNLINGNISTMQGKTIKPTENVNGFQVIKLPKVTFPAPNITPTDEKIIQDAYLAGCIQKENGDVFFVGTSDIPAPKDVKGGSLEYELFRAYKNTLPEKYDKISGAYNAKLTSIIDANRKLLVDVQKAETESVVTKSKLGKLSIKSVFSQISKDASYTLGRILEAGAKGYANNSSRKTNTKLIGKSFPLMIDETTGEEVPAENTNAGIERYEMRLVNEFIDGLSKAVAEKKQLDALAQVSGNETVVSQYIGPNRICNLETIQKNPYRADSKNIIENILVRSGIAAFYVGQFNLNKPPSSSNVGDVKKEDIREAAKQREVNLLTDSILQALDSEKRLETLKFAEFVMAFITPDGEFKYTEQEDGTDYSFGNDSNFYITDSLFFDREIEINSNQLGGKYKDSARKRILPYVDDYFKGAGKPKVLYCSKPIWPQYVATSCLNNDIWYSVTNVMYTYFTTNALSQGQDKTVYALLTEEEYNKFSNSISSESNSGDILITLNESEDPSKKNLKKIDDSRAFGRIVSYSDVIASRRPNGGATSAFGTYPYPAFKEFSYDTNDSTHQIVKGGAILYSSIPDSNNDFLIWGLFAEGDDRFIAQRIFLYEMCKHIKDKLSVNQAQETRAAVISESFKHKNAIYKQMHILFHQWSSFLMSDPSNPCNGDMSSTGDIAKTVQEKFSSHHLEKKGKKMKEVYANNNISDSFTTFVYDFPLQALNSKSLSVNVGDSIINIDPINDANGNTTVLNIIQQICTKNNFMFIPFPGDALTDDLNKLLEPSVTDEKQLIRNYFHVLFTPTPETRANLNDGPNTNLTDIKPNDISADFFEVKYGSVDNKLFTNVSVGTAENKPSVESILNLQRLVDADNKNKTVTKDCSMLSVYEGRSYVCKVDMIGNAQIYPMQYFYLSNMPLFGGLYQILKVRHSITPNDMKTTFEGIRTRYNAGSGFGAVYPVTGDHVVDAIVQGSLTQEEANAILDVNNRPQPGVPMDDIITVDTLKRTFTKKNYELLDNTKLNIIGVRKNLDFTNTFDDTLVLYWKRDGKDYIQKYRASTKPGGGSKVVNYLKSHPGSASDLMKDGQYKNIYIHYPARIFPPGIGGPFMADHGPGPNWKFYRQTIDSISKKQYIFTNELQDKPGFFIHSGSLKNSSSGNVDNWSLGCQVFANWADLIAFMNIMKVFQSQGQTTFNYTLLMASDLS